MAREPEREQAADGMKSDLYFSADVETTGPTPVRNFLRSVGVVGIRDGQIIDTFSRNITEASQPGAIWESEDKDVIDAGMKDVKTFWAEHPAADAATRLNQISVGEAFEQLGEFVKGLTRPNEVPVFVAYPAGFDFMWCATLANLYAPGTWPFGFAPFCMQSMAATLLNVSFSQGRQKNWPEAWKRHMRHTHISLEDALDQAKVFVEMQRFQYGSNFVVGNRSVAIGGNITNAVISTGSKYRFGLSGGESE
jgi:hypothetical protein